jgi:hypothetical protein
VTAADAFPELFSLFINNNISREQFLIQIYPKILTSPCPLRLFSNFPSLSSKCLFGWLVADGWCWFLLREEYF